ncbi:MAG: cation diffusion facilitator family transporter [Synergistaceae bacterium]|nr:cation diffusion facilitator family transporter [Synergistaceae bacterium]
MVSTSAGRKDGSYLLCGSGGGQLAVRVSVVSIGVNALLAAFKLFAGIYAHSGAIVSDAVHTISDVLSTIVVIIGIRVSGRVADENHQYGHERFESVAAILLAAMLAAVGAGIGLSGVRNVLNSASGNIAVPGRLALAAAALSIALKEAMYWYTRDAARRTGSGALMADAWHHRSDAMSSVGSFAGVLGARMGYPALDPVVSIVICCFIVKAAVGIFVEAVRKMTDEACDQDTIRKLETLVSEQAGVLGVDALQTRRFGERIYVDVEIRADGELSLKTAHGIAEGVHDRIEEMFPSVKHCMVHVNPSEARSGKIDASGGEIGSAGIEGDRV